MAGAGPARRSSRQYLPARRQRDVRHDAHARGLSQPGQLRQRLPEDRDVGRAGRGGLFRDVRYRGGDQRRQRISGSGGTLVLPDLLDGTGQTRHLAVGAGKDGHIYVVNRDAMGKWNAASNQSYQDISGALGGSVSDARLLQQHGVLRRHGQHAQGVRRHERPAGLECDVGSARSFAYPGTTRASRRRQAMDCLGGRKLESRRPHAYDARSDAGALQLEQAAAAHQFGAGNKFITPTIVNGQVFVNTSGVAGSAAGPDRPEDRSLASVDDSQPGRR